MLVALKDKQIKGAALDVFYEEPLPKESKLWDAENLILIPHISGKTKYFFDRCINLFQETFKLYYDNKPMKFEVDLEKGF